MARRWLPVCLALVLTAGAVAWALVGLPGRPAACLPAGCDCEVAHPGPIRQPINAWSSLALTAAGLFTAIASPGRRPGEARGPRARAEGASHTQGFAGGDAPAGRRARVCLPRWRGGGSPQEASPGEARRGRRRRAEGADHKRAGSRSFALPPTPSRLRREGASDGLPRGSGGGARAAGPSGEGNDREARVHSLTRRVAAGALVAAGLGAFLYHAGLTAWAARLDGITVAVLVAAVALDAVGRLVRPPSRAGAQPRAAWRRLAPWLFLVLGAACWWLGRSGGPWCRPDSLGQAHAAWHLLAAGAIVLWLSPRRNSPQLPPASSLRAERPAGS